MSNKAIENKYRQVIPIVYLTPPNGDPKLYLLLSRQRIVMDALAVSQDLTDKASAGYVTISTTTDGKTSWLDNY